MKTFAQETKEEILKNFRPENCCPGAYFTARALKSGVVPSFFGKKPCCVKAFLTGAFLECGTVSITGVYHLEFVLPRADIADDIMKILADLNIKSKKTARGTAFVVYLKDSDEISDLLALLGASLAVLKLQSLKVDRNIRSRENRATNCITANIDKAVNAAARQTEAILYIREHGGLSQLPKKLCDAAEIRLLHREESAEELAAYFSPRLSKSGVIHRLNKIIETAQELKKEELR